MAREKYECYFKLGSVLIMYVSKKTWTNYTKVGWPLDVAWQNSTWPNLHRLSSFFCSFSWVRAPPKENFFFVKSDIKWDFLTYSNTLEIHVINL